MSKAGIKLILQRLNNEASKALTNAIMEKGLEYKLVSPYDHQLNLEEQAIQNYKNYLIINLNGYD